MPTCLQPEFSSDPAACRGKFWLGCSSQGYRPNLLHLSLEIAKWSLAASFKHFCYEATPTPSPFFPAPIPPCPAALASLHWACTLCTPGQQFSRAPAPPTPQTAECPLLWGGAGHCFPLGWMLCEKAAPFLFSRERYPCRRLEDGYRTQGVCHLETWLS